MYRNSSLSTALEDNLLGTPAPKLLDDGKTEVPLVLVADDAFPYV